MVGVGVDSDVENVIGKRETGACPGVGTDAEYEREGLVKVGAGAGTDGTAEKPMLGDEEATEEPSARLTKLMVGVLPLKNSAAVTEGSVDGAGG